MTFKNPDFSTNSPYYDDFEETKNFLKILFKPGYAVQARELTQLQTILQSQIAKFADHVFLNGSQVFGGEIQILNVPFVRVEKTTYNTSGVSTGESANTFLSELNESNLLKVFRKDGSTFTELATIKVSYFEPSGYSTNDDYCVLFYGITGIAETVASGEFAMVRDLYFGVDSTGPFLNVINPTLVETSPENYYDVEFSGNGFLVTVNDGIFYIDGYFVNTPKQTISLYKRSATGEAEPSIETTTTYSWAKDGIRLFNKPSHRIGYTINREIITASDDTTLTDPARGFYNFNAPGADRYKIGLELSFIEYEFGVVDLDNYVTNDFIQILRTTRGIVDYIKNKTSYAQLLDIFARRTQDESGSYTVVPFVVEPKNHLRKDKYIFTVNLSASSQSVNNELFESVKSGGYIWQGNNTYNPYDPAATPISQVSFAVGKVVDIIKDYNTLTNSRSLKIVAELQNNKKFSSTGSTSYRYKTSISSSTLTIIVSSLETQIDPKGAFSLLDIPAGDSDKLAFSIQPGKAYVYGYEYETFAPRNVEYLINGNQSPTKSLDGLNVDFYLGNYVKGAFTEAFPTENINFEKMPLLELVDEDSSTLLMFQSGAQTTNRGIYAWAPFKYTSEQTQGDMVDMKIITGNELTIGDSYPHESVLFVEYIEEE